MVREAVRWATEGHGPIAFLPGVPQPSIWTSYRTRLS